MLRRAFFAVMVAATLVACSKGSDSSGNVAGAASQLPLLISPEDVVTVRSSALASGPLITGSVQPERRADLRAEVPAVVLRVLKENGDIVRRGDLLVQLDDTAIRDVLTAADASARAASRAFEQAERQYQRMLTLRTSGMVSTQAVEDAEIRRNNAQSDLEAARTRTVQARQQLQRTEARAPFDGVVSDRKVSAGDTAQIGKELLKVIDPRSMRFEGLVSADNIGEVKIGQSVVFRVNGYAEQEFTGKITKLNPAANATTRQVEVLVEFSERSEQPKLAGLYAEGRIETTRRTGLTVPATALLKEGDKVFLWRVGRNALQKVSVVIGQRDPRSGDFVLKSGLAEGDIVLRYPTAALKDGQKIEMARAFPTAVVSARTDVATKAPVTAASGKEK